MRKAFIFSYCKVVGKSRLRSSSDLTKSGKYKVKSGSGTGDLPQHPLASRLISIRTFLECFPHGLSGFRQNWSKKGEVQLNEKVGKKWVPRAQAAL